MLAIIRLSVLFVQDSIVLYYIIPSGDGSAATTSVAGFVNLHLCMGIPFARASLQNSAGPPSRGG
jgi:hypothetical protein